MLSEQLRDQLLDYLEDRLPANQRHEIELLLQQDPELRAEFDALCQLRKHAEDWQDQSVPGWHRTDFLIPKPDLSHQWLPWLSFAASCAALLLVIFNFYLMQSPSDKDSSIAGQHALIGRPQTQWLENRFTEFQQEQLGYVQQVAFATLDACRRERIDDMQRLTDYWTHTRNQDRLLINDVVQTQYQQQNAFKSWLTRASQ